MDDQTIRSKVCKLARILADWNLAIPEREYMSPTILLDGLLLLLNIDIDPNIFMASHNYNMLDRNDEGYYIPSVREPEIGDLILFMEIMEDPTKLGIITDINKTEYSIVRFEYIQTTNQGFYRIRHESISKDSPDIGIFYHL